MTPHAPVSPPEDIRFTKKDDVLYALALGHPQDGRIEIESLAEGSAHYPGAISEVNLLGAPGAVAWSRTSAGLTVTLPGSLAPAPAYALRITPAV